MPPTYYREVRQLRRTLEICLKCGKADAEFPYTCCTRCRARQTKMDNERARAKRSQKATHD